MYFEPPTMKFRGLGDTQHVGIQKVWLGNSGRLSGGGDWDEWGLRWGSYSLDTGWLSPDTGGFWEGWTGLMATGELMLASEVAVPSCPPSLPLHFTCLPSSPLARALSPV